MSDVTFPFSQWEWNGVQRAARAVVNATLADDDVLRAVHFARLKRVLKRLRLKYGEHSILVETEADFSDDPAERHALYVHALELAQRDGLPSFTIRLSFASSLHNEDANKKQVVEQLVACKDEIQKMGEDSDRKKWAELMNAVKDGSG
jgi:uncharacterized ferritin-like protein (DUF455 family)